MYKEKYSHKPVAASFLIDGADYILKGDRQDDGLRYAPDIIAKLGRVHCNQCGNVDYLIQQGSHCYNLVCSKCGKGDWHFLVSVHP